MRKLLALTLTALLAAAATAVPATEAAAAAASDATVTTDKTDYQPGETVVISGSGWAAGETVSLTLKEDPAHHADTALSATADEYGNLLNKEFSPTREHVGTTFTLTAVGQASGRTATATFTDGGSMNYSPNNQTLNIQSDASPQSASFSQTVSAPRGNGNFTASLQVTGTGLTPLPAAWVSATPNPLSYSTGTGTPTVFFPQTRTVTVTVPPFTPAGTYTAQVRANPNITGVGIGAGTNLSVVVTSDNAPPNTTLGAVKADTTAYNGVDWTNQDVIITLSATDTGTPATGVASTQYKIDLGAYQTYTAPFTISSEGLHTVTYFSTDNSGNVEGGQTFTVKIDKTAPAPNCGSADGAWHNDNVSITCSPSDSGGSGLLSPGDITLTTSVADGTEDANASTDSQSVCDNAGNCATAGPVNGNMIDRKAPTYNCGTADGNWHAADVSIPCTAADGGSGLAEAGDASFSLTTSVPNNTEDPNASTDSNEVCDGVGNCVTAGPIAGNMVDKKAPSVSCGAADGLWHAADVSIPCTASDGGSGLANPSDASFSLTTSVPANTETSNASTNSHAVADAVGNSATAGPIAGNMVDKKSPTFLCDSPDGAWHANDVTLQCTASDGGSGVNGSTNASLSTSVLAGTETSNASTGSHVFTDNVGNSATAGPISGNKVDKKAPVINITTPPNGASYLLNQSVASSYTATDGGSGVASSTPASGSALNTASVGSKTFAVTATDNVGNQSNASASYTVGYGFVALYDQTKSVKRGATIPIKIRLVDANGANVSSPSIVVSAIKLVLVGGGASDAIISDQNNANGDGNFRYDASLGGYIFNLSTKNMGLIDGTWRLDFAPAGDPVAHSVYFGVVR